MKHILIDYENIQPKSFDDIEVNGCHIWLFLGVNQQRSLPLELVETLLRFDNDTVHIIKMQHAGKNALDFYLSFYLGKISEIDPKADVCILAKDSGYDILVEHLNGAYNGMKIMRAANANQLTVVYESNENTALDIEKSQLVVEDNQNTLCDNVNKVVKEKKEALASQDNSEKSKPSTTTYQRAIAAIKSRPITTRPAKKSSLINYLKSHLRNEDPKDIDKIVKQMVGNKVIVISNTNKVSYKM